jgi:aminoglycoside phosphotransferase (APT) family kinase protein
VHRGVAQFGGGASNLISLLRYPGRYPGRDLVLRRPPTGQKAASAHGLARECRVQQHPVGQRTSEIHQRSPRVAIS